MACGVRDGAAVSARRSCGMPSFASPSGASSRPGLGIDAENTTNAVALYERVGMRVVRRSDTLERRV